MDVKIEKGVPIPDSRKKNQYGLVAEAMGVGDSVNVPTVEARNSLYSYLRVLAYKPVTKKLKDGTYRLWRTK
jgi:hypothetical protein